VGGGPVGTSTAWFLAEREHDVLLIHDPKDAGAHEDWSRLARLSFDGPPDEMECSKHAIELLDLIEEVRSMNAGAPAVPIKPGMLFVASPGTNMALACARGEAYGEEGYRRVELDELDELFPGNPMTLPEGTLCWTHPAGYCVSPMELCDANLKTCLAYGVEENHGRVSLDVGSDGEYIVQVDNGDVFATRKLYLMAGAYNKAICQDSPAPQLSGIKEFETMYISAISTIRYRHRNHPSAPSDPSFVVPPITLGQLELPGVCDFQANFSVVAEEYGDVLKTRLSGDIGTEVVPRVEDMKANTVGMDDAKMAQTYGAVFGSCFPYLETEKPLDFNRCVTYRNHIPAFSGTSLLEVEVGEGDKTSKMLTTVGCFGVGVKFGPVLGEAAADFTDGEELKIGMNVFQSGMDHQLDGEMIERAW